MVGLIKRTVLGDVITRLKFQFLKGNIIADSCSENYLRQMIENSEKALERAAADESITMHEKWNLQEVVDLRTRRLEEGQSPSWRGIITWVARSLAPGQDPVIQFLTNEQSVDRTSKNGVVIPASEDTGPRTFIVLRTAHDMSDTIRFLLHSELNEWVRGPWLVNLRSLHSLSKGSPQYNDMVLAFLLGMYRNLFQGQRPKPVWLAQTAKCLLGDWPENMQIYSAYRADKGPNMSLIEIEQLLSEISGRDIEPKCAASEYHRISGSCLEFLDFAAYYLDRLPGTEATILLKEYLESQGRLPKPAELARFYLQTSGISPNLDAAHIQSDVGELARDNPDYSEQVSSAFRRLRGQHLM